MRRIQVIGFPGTFLVLASLAVFTCSSDDTNSGQDAALTDDGQGTDLANADLDDTSSNEQAPVDQGQGNDSLANDVGNDVASGNDLTGDEDSSEQLVENQNENHSENFEFNELGHNGKDCPATPPGLEQSCGNFTGVCTYMDCASYGIVIASCLDQPDSTWNIQIQECQSFSCGNVTCKPGQLCYMASGGFEKGECISHDCNTELLTCECVLPSCGGDCMIMGNKVICVEIRK